jgi:hypothetical protein
MLISSLNSGVRRVGFIELINFIKIEEHRTDQ